MQQNKNRKMCVSVQNTSMGFEFYLCVLMDNLKGHEKCINVCFLLNSGDNALIDDTSTGSVVTVTRQQCIYYGALCWLDTTSFSSGSII